jgi:hypothetical protein
MATHSCRSLCRRWWHFGRPKNLRTVLSEVKGKQLNEPTIADRRSPIAL